MESAESEGQSVCLCTISYQLEALLYEWPQSGRVGVNSVAEKDEEEIGGEFGVF